MWTSWKLRRGKLLARFNAAAIKLYYKQFYPNELSNHDLEKHFAKHFNRLYGKKHYVIPLIILGVLSGLGLLATLLSIESWITPGKNVVNFSPIIISAFLGAYAWVLSDQLTRYQKNDFLSQRGFHFHKQKSIINKTSENETPMLANPFLSQRGFHFHKQKSIINKTPEMKPRCLLSVPGFGG